MKLTRRLARLEARLEVMDEKRKGLLLQHIALRTSFIALMPLISASSTSQRINARAQAIAHVTTVLLLAESDEQETAQVLQAIELMFDELDAVHAEADQPPDTMSH